MPLMSDKKVSEDMPLIYIAGPFRGETAWEVEYNIRQAEGYILTLAKVGAVGVCPHSMYRYFDGAMPDQYWLTATAELLRRCDGLLLTPWWKSSEGSKAENRVARELAIPVLDLESAQCGGLSSFVEVCRVKKYGAPVEITHDTTD